MSRRLGLLVLTLCLACLVPVLKYSVSRYGFDNSKEISIKSYHGLASDGEDPLSTELNFCRQFVHQTLQDVEYPMSCNPNLIYVLPWCEDGFCGLDMVWLGANPATGVKLQMAGGQSLTIPFDEKTVESNKRQTGLAREVLLEWVEGSFVVNKSNIADIETVTLLDSQNTTIGNAREPRTAQKQRGQKTRKGQEKVSEANQRGQGESKGSSESKGSANQRGQAS